MKYVNKNYTSGIAKGIDDNLNFSDYILDFWNQKESQGKILEQLTGGGNVLIKSAGNPVQGTGYTITVPAIAGTVRYNVVIPQDWTTKPPPVTSSDLYILVETTNVSISASTATVGVTNYLKVKYIETENTSRTKAHSATTWNAYVTPSFTLVADSVAPTIYDLLLATFTTNGTTITWSTYTSVLNNLYTESALARNADNLTSGTVALARIPTTLTGKDADLLDGQHGSYYLKADNLTGSIPPAVIQNGETVVYQDASAVETTKVLKKKIVEIGTWDMSSGSKRILLNLSTSKTILSVSCFVRKDNASTYYWDLSGQTSGIQNGGIGDWSTAYSSQLSVTLVPNPNGIFYTTSYFNGTSVNRGFVIVNYID